MDYKKEFIELLKTTNRQGIDDLVEELEDLGFFKAPASTKFHLNEDGGLVQHSLNVCKAALSMRKSMIELDDSLLEALPKDSVIIASLLHDTSKADIFVEKILILMQRKRRIDLECGAMYQVTMLTIQTFLLAMAKSLLLCCYGLDSS